MAGIYLHIPFCRQACTYCNFHFSTQLQHKPALLDALLQEIRLRSDFLEHAPVRSVYFGGGTPSLLSAEEIRRIMDTITALHSVTADAEITLEANPDDLSQDDLDALRDTPVNRLSIGIQSFYDDELQYMHRLHHAAQGIASLERAMQAGFASLTMDLIYGTPLLTPQRWKDSLQRVADMGIPHLSAYQLTVEPKTALAHQIRTGESPAPDDENTVMQFDMLMDWADASGFAHYEISNLAKPGHRAIHNSNYWKGMSYIGIGPSAHSFNGCEREWNIANNARYIKAIKHGSARESSEVLSPADRYNEYVMTGLRTMEGVSESVVSEFGPEYYSHFIQCIAVSVAAGLVKMKTGSWALTRKGKHFADKIAAECFY